MTEEILVKRPVVAGPSTKTSPLTVASMLGALGLGVFFLLSQARASGSQEGQLPSLPQPSSTAPAAEPPPTPPATAAPKPGDQTAFWIPNKPPVLLQPSQPAASGILAAPPIAQAATPTPDENANRMNERLRAPALVVDLAQAAPANGSGAVVTDGGTRPNQSSAPIAGRPLSDTEQFSSRVGQEEVQVAEARQMVGLDRLVPQGAVIGGVMETALNSDLPGYARAIVQRDVYSFDGSAVLIPAGSKLIGQYKSGVAQGASRVFVLWTRLIRPDGVTIELASPATDELGRGGLGGKVNRHFLQRFGGAILTSVISGGISAASAALSGGSTIIVGSAGQATNLAAQATQSSDIPPTITTKQGANVRIFVARDLDFSTVGPVK